MDEKMIHNIAIIIVVIAAINTGIIGLIQRDLLFLILTAPVSRLVQILIGVAGTYIALKQFNLIK